MCIAYLHVCINQTRDPGAVAKHKPGVTVHHPC